MSQSHNTDGIGMSNQELFSQGGARLVPSVVPIQEVDAREKHQNGESGFAVPVSPTVGPLTTHHTPHGHGCAGVNNQEAFSGHLIPVAFGGNNLSGPINVSPALNAHPSASGRCDFESEAFLVHGYSIDKEHSDATGPLLKDSPTGGGRPLPAVVIPFDTTQITSDKNYSSPKSGEPCHPLASGAHPPAIAFCNTGGDTNLGLSEDGGQTAPPITTRNGDPGCVAFAQNTRDEVRLIGGDGQIAGALASETGMKQQSYVAQPIAIRGRGEGRDLELGTEGIANAILTPNCGRDGDPIQGGGGKPGQGDQSVRSNMAVRRLTPVECEVLQGFPRFHSLIQWRGKSAEECPDGPRYKALGNSMAVPVMAWIGSRIDLVAKRTGYGQPMNPVHHTPPTHEKRRRTQRKK